jgi:hypothetical protein
MRVHPALLIITAKMFKEAVGHEPEDDDLERCNCLKRGIVGHDQCGWDTKHNLPRFMTIMWID